MSRNDGNTNSVSKLQFQVNHGAGWETIAEVAAIDGIFHPPNAWLMVRAMGKRVVYPEPISSTAFTIKESEVRTPGYINGTGWAEIYAQGKTGEKAEE